MDSRIDDFNRIQPAVIHLDINSCFATIEQQANPLLRGKPVVVAAYKTMRGCILAPSIEAKKLGMRVAMKVSEGRALCPNVIVLEADPNKYRYVHHQLKRIISQYDPGLIPKSIDEFVFRVEKLPKRFANLEELANEIKTKIREEIGEWMTVSVGIGPNRFLAKTAAGLKKPDGLERIDQHNFRKVFDRLSLTDLNGIATRNEMRLKRFGVGTVTEFHQASIQTLRAVFGGANGNHWYMKLRGYEVEEGPTLRKSYGHEYSLPKPYIEDEDIWPITTKLMFRAGSRMRKDKGLARELLIAVRYRDGSNWHTRINFPTATDDPFYITLLARKEITKRPKKPVRLLAVSFFNLVFGSNDRQMELFRQVEMRRSLIASMDKINKRWGEFALIPAAMNQHKGYAKDAIGFGRLSEITGYTSEAS